MRNFLTLIVGLVVAGVLVTGTILFDDAVHPSPDESQPQSYVASQLEPSYNVQKGGLPAEDLQGWRPLEAGYRQPGRLNRTTPYWVAGVGIVCTVLLIAIVVLRSVLRINEMVKYQRETAEHLRVLRQHFENQGKTVNR